MKFYYISNDSQLYFSNIDEANPDFKSVKSCSLPYSHYNLNYILCNSDKQISIWNLEVESEAQFQINLISTYDIENPEKNQLMNVKYGVFDNLDNDSNYFYGLTFLKDDDPPASDTNTDTPILIKNYIKFDIYKYNVLQAKSNTNNIEVLQSLDLY